MIGAFFLSSKRQHTLCVVFFFFKVIFNICQVGCPVQEWKLFCQKLGVTEIIDFQVHGHVYGALRRPFSLISIPEGSCTYLN